VQHQLLATKYFRLRKVLVKILYENLQLVRSFGAYRVMRAEPVRQLYNAFSTGTRTPLIVDKGILSILSRQVVITRDGFSESGE
jgi:hypothetical protein